MRIRTRCVRQFRVNSMTRKAFTTRKEHKQSHFRRRRKPAFPNCTPIDGPLSDNALDVYFCYGFSVTHWTSAKCRRYRIICFLDEHSLPMGIVEMGNISGDHNVIGWRMFTRRFVKTRRLPTIDKCALLTKKKNNARLQRTRTDAYFEPNM